MPKKVLHKNGEKLDYGSVYFPKIRFWCEEYPSIRCPTLMEPFILFCLSQQPLCGYEIIQVLKESGINYKVEEYGFFYKTLNILKGKELVLPACCLMQKSESIIKTRYFITDKGRKKLKQWANSLAILKEGLDTFIEHYQKL